MLGSHNLMQHVSESTHNDGNILDLVITLSAESRLVSQFSTRPAFFSDHKLVLCKLHMPRSEPVVVTPTYPDIRKNDMESFQRDVLSSALYTDDISHHTADSYAELFSTEVNRLPDVHAPIRSKIFRSGAHQPHWLSDKPRAAKRTSRR